jgi:hypothetical protein
LYRFDELPESAVAQLQIADCKGRVLDLFPRLSFKSANSHVSAIRPALVGLFGDRFESGILIDASRGGNLALSPQLHFLVTCFAGKADAPTHTSHLPGRIEYGGTIATKRQVL